MNPVWIILAAASVVSLPVGIDWRKDYDAARIEAREQGRLVLLHFTLDGRPLCRAMDEETFADEDVARVAREKFVGVRVDAEAKADLFESTIGGRGGLATCIVDATGDVVSALHGYAGPQSFRRFLESAAAGYKGLVQARSAVEKQPNANVDLYALGEAYRSLNSLRRAEQCYLKVVEQPEKYPQSTSIVASAHERIARLRILRGKNLEARKHLDAIRALDPDGRLEMADRASLTEALTLAVERKHLDAARVLQDALKRFPASAEADHMLYALGFVLHQAGQDKPALEALEAAQQRFPQSSWLPAVREQIEHLRNPQPDHTH